MDYNGKEMLYRRLLEGFIISLSDTEMRMLGLIISSKLVITRHVTLHPQIIITVSVNEP